jgi:hypothetical protein
MGVRDWIYVAQDRHPVVCRCEHGNETSRTVNRGEFPDSLSIQRACQEGLCSVELLRF